jgi:hypothetical protein
MPGPADLFAQIQANKEAKGGRGGPSPLAAMLQGRKAPPPAKAASVSESPKGKTPVDVPGFGGKPFIFDSTKDGFVFASHYEKDVSLTTPSLVADEHGNPEVDISVPLAPCLYRMTDYTYSKKEPMELERIMLKLNVIRCLALQCETLNSLLWHRLNPSSVTAFPDTAPLLEEDSADNSKSPPGGYGSIEQDELGKTRFMELLSSSGVSQKVSELILKRAAQVADYIKGQKPAGNDRTKNPYRVPQVRVEGLEEFLVAFERLAPSLQQARDEIEQTASVSFYPGLGELFTPGSKLSCFPEGMEGTPLGCQVVQCWYDEELNKATGKVKRRFILCVEFIVSVGDQLVFVAASDVYPEFHDPSRNVPVKDLTHRKLLPETNEEDKHLMERLQQRGEFYASVAVKNHYLEYHPDTFFPIIGGGWSNNAVRPLSKGGRVMIDVKRSILEGHIPVRGSSDGMSDTVKEAIKLYEQSKRTGLAVPFRTCILPGFDGFEWNQHGDSDRQQLWQAWPMLAGFSFTARVWGKLLLGMPKIRTQSLTPSSDSNQGSSKSTSPRRPSSMKWGVSVGALGGVGRCSSCSYINFREEAFEQLVLAEDKKELIRAVARNAGGGPKLDDDEDDSDDDDIGIDVVANKGGASIFLLHGPPGCGKVSLSDWRY